MPGVHGCWIRTPHACRRPSPGTVCGFTRRFDSLAGLRSLPDRVCLRLLDLALRWQLGGLDEVTVPVDPLAALRLPIERVLIVENLQTGLSCEALSGTALLIARGYALDDLRSIEWPRTFRLFNWGDIDTHGLAILHRLRTHAPRTFRRCAAA